MSIYRAQVSFPISPFIPDADTVFLEIGDIRISFQKPKKLVNNGFNVEFFCREERKAFAKIYAHLMTKYTDSPGACPITFTSAMIQYMVEEILINLQLIII